MTSAGELVQPSSGSEDVSFSFPATFLNVLTAPIATFKELADPIRVNIDRSRLFSALLVVVLASLIASQGHNTTRGDTPHLASVAIPLIADLTLWYSIAWLTSSLSSWQSAPPEHSARPERVELKRALVLSGWAFLPLIFTGPCALFCRASSGADFLLLLISLWFIFLQIAVFESLLNLGRGKTISLLIVLPPVLFLVYIFWILLGSALVLSSLTSLLPVHTSY